MARVFTRFRVALLAVAVAVGIAVPALAKLLSADEVLRQIEGGLKGAHPEAKSKAAGVLADIKRFRAESGAMDARKAADAWLDLYDRAAALGRGGWQGDFGTFDVETTNVGGLQPVRATLPGPDSWAALREGAKARAGQAPGDARALALRFVTELLAGDL